MYIDFIYHDWELDFTQEDVINGGWWKKMMLLIMLDKYGDKDEDKDNDLEFIQINQKLQMVFKEKRQGM
jgi:hypothetical protein